MGTDCELQPLNSAEASRWDELITSYEGAELFHRQAWLDYLAESRQVQIKKWAIREHGQIIGYFCGGVIHKGPFAILGSPLKGWGTNFMGPVGAGCLNESELLNALDRVARAERLAMIELQYRRQSATAVRAAAYEPVLTRTFVVPLNKNVETMWNALYPTCRNRVRKAIKSGLAIEIAEDPSVAVEFYEQYCELMRYKQLTPPYPRRYPMVLFQHLKPSNLLLPLRVRDDRGRVLATGMFPHDDQTMYFWGGASWQSGREHCPNEFLHWSAMRIAAERGVTRYDMCGNGRFKEKFGGTLVDLERWHKFYWHSARWARWAYEKYCSERQYLEGWWRAHTHAVSKN